MLVEQKFSLELTKNGRQRTIYAKQGEASARKLKITLTVSGEVISLEGYSIKALFDDETYLNVESTGNPVSLTIPSALCGEAGERVIELQLVSGGETVYSPQFTVIVEETIGAEASSEPIGETVQYEPLLATAGDYSGTLDGDEKIPIYDPDVGATRLYPLSEMASADDVEDLSEGLDGKVDKVTGKGLSTNDYDATEKANVASNTLARHTHSNKTVLDKFGESGGKPTYDGEEIGGGGSYENIIDVQDEEGNSLVNADKIAIVPAGGKQIEIVRTVAGVDRSIYTPAELKAYVDAGRGLLYKGNVVISYSYVDDEVDGFFTAYYFVGAASFQGQKVNNDKSIITRSGLPARPMFTAEYEKLRNIEARAEVNVINAVERADGTAVVPVNKKITLPAQVVVSDTEPTDTSVLWIDTSDDTVDGIDNGEEISFPQEVGE